MSFFLCLFFLIAASAARATVGVWGGWGSWREQRLIGSFTSPLGHQLVDSLILLDPAGFKAPTSSSPP